MVGYSDPLLPGFIRRRYALRFGAVLGVAAVAVGGMGLGLGATTAYQVPTDLVVGAVGGILVSGLLGGVLVQRTMDTVESIRTNADQLRDGDLDVDFDQERVDGVGQLAGSLAALRDAVDEQRAQAQADRRRFEECQRQLEATATEYADGLDAARTDRSVRLPTDVQSDAMATVGVACNELLQTRQSQVDDLEARCERSSQEAQELKAQAMEYADVFEECAEGDLGQRMDEDVDSPIAAEFAARFNEMMSQFEWATVEAENFATEVATLGNEVTVSTAEVREGSEQVASSLNTISDVTETQFENLDAVVSDMTDLSAAIEEIDASSSDVADIAQQTVETGRAGREAATEAIDGMKEIEQESVDTVEEIERLESAVQQIDELIEFIREVAEQTNMLALNANIEASRAGESGQGFAVVAREIKELAKGTKDAAADIETRLEEIQTRTSETVEEVRETREKIARHTGSVENAANALNDIAENARDTNAGVQDVSSVMSQQADATQAVLAAVDGATETSAETVEEATATARGAEEQTRALSAVSDRAEALSTQATRLKQTLDQFETDGAAVAGANADSVAADAVDTESDDPSERGDGSALEVEAESGGPEAVEHPEAVGVEATNGTGLTDAGSADDRDRERDTEAESRDSEEGQSSVDGTTEP
jgi:methyl-accepting chemotaxis protein